MPEERTKTGVVVKSHKEKWMSEKDTYISSAKDMENMAVGTFDNLSP